MRNELLATINNTIDNSELLFMEIHAGSIGASISFVPDYVDEGSTNIVIYSEDNIYTIDTTDISWDEMEEKFVCGNKNCIVYISTEQY